MNSRASLGVNVRLPNNDSFIIYFLRNMISEREFRKYVQTYKNNKESDKSYIVTGRFNTSYNVNVDVSKLVDKHKSFTKNVNKMLKKIKEQNDDDISTYQQMNNEASQKITKLENKVKKLHKKI